MMFLFLLPAIGLVYTWLIRLFVRNFLLGWICVLVATGLDYSLGTDRFLLGSLHIDPIDLLYFCLLPAGIIRSRFHELRISGQSAIILGYLLLFCLSVARGLPLFGLASVGNECRGFISEVVALTYFTTIPHDRATIKKVVIALIVLATFYLVVCGAFYAGLPVGSRVGLTDQLASYETSTELDRALTATPAALIAVTMFLAASWAVYRRANRWLHLLVGLFAGAVIALQHRTVWTMVLVALLASASLDQKLFRYLLKVCGTLAAVAVLVALGSTGLRSKLSEDLEDSATNSDTFVWRLQAWERSVSEDQSVLTVLIGQPMGSKYTRIDTNSGGYTFDVPPHNEFILQYLRVGLIGTVLLLLFFLRPIYIYFSNPESGSLLYPAPAPWIVVTISIVVFHIPYGNSIELMALIGMTNGLVGAPQQGRRCLTGKRFQPTRVAPLDLPVAVECSEAIS